MTLSLLIIVLLAQVALVTGQIFLKHGMSQTTAPARRPWRIADHIAAGIAMLTAWFLLWMGLLQKLDISFVYPFEGISPVLLVLAAGLVLRERMGWKMWTGVALIAVGTALVGLS